MGLLQNFGEMFVFAAGSPHVTKGHPGDRVPFSFLRRSTRYRFTKPSTPVRDAHRKQGRLIGNGNPPKCDQRFRVPVQSRQTQMSTQAITRAPSRFGLGQEVRTRIGASLP